jgi:hypothetical protein
MLLKLNACGKLKGYGSAGAEEPACRADSRIEIALTEARGKSK